MITEGGGEAGTSQLQSSCKKGRLMNIYFLDSDEEAILDFLKDHNKNFTTRPTSKEGLPMGEVCQQLQPVDKRVPWFESQRTCFRKHIQSKSGQVPKEMTERYNWIQDKFDFLKTHLIFSLQVPRPRSKCNRSSAHNISSGFN